MYTTNNYPTSIQDPVDPIASNNTSAFDHAGLETFQNESIKALKDKVGADGSAVTSSHDYKLSEVTSTDKAVGKTATQTLTNKTLTAPTVNTPTVTDASLSGDTQIDIGSDATGDLLVRKSTGKLGRIAAGTTGQVLTSNGAGTEPTYQTPSVVTATQLQNQSLVYATAGGTANAITVTLSPAPTAYTAGMKLSFKATATNTGATTINVNGLGIKDIKKNGNVSLIAGDIVINGIYELTYDGTNLVIANTDSNTYEFISLETSGSQGINSGSTTLKTINVPAGSFKIGASYKIKLQFSYYAGNFSAQNWTLSIKFGGSDVYVYTHNKGGSGSNDGWEGYINTEVTINNQSSASQLSSIFENKNLYYLTNSGNYNVTPSTFIPFQTTSTSVSTTVDTSSSQNITLVYNGVTAGNGGTITFGRVLIERFG